MPGAQVIDVDGSCHLGRAVSVNMKKGKKGECVAATEWLAAMSTHVPTKAGRMVRSYGYYSNARRGNRKKRNEDQLISSVL